MFYWEIAVTNIFGIFFSVETQRRNECTTNSSFNFNFYLFSLRVALTFIEKEQTE